jgi:hypothetical protein
MKFFINTGAFRIDSVDMGSLCYVDLVDMESHSKLTQLMRSLTSHCLLKKLTMKHSNVSKIDQIMLKVFTRLEAKNLLCVN